MFFFRQFLNLEIFISKWILKENTFPLFNKYIYIHTHTYTGSHIVLDSMLSAEDTTIIKSCFCVLPWLTDYTGTHRYSTLGASSVQWHLGKGWRERNYRRIDLNPEDHRTLQPQVKVLISLKENKRGILGASICFKFSNYFQIWNLRVLAGFLLRRCGFCWLPSRKFSCVVSCLIWPSSLFYLIEV